MKIVPDISMSTFPEGGFIVGYEGGIVSDLYQNYNEGSISLMFTVSRSAGCPFLYLTGFSTEDVNPNGVFSNVDPVNMHAAWRGGSDGAPLYLYWKLRDPERRQPGSWILSTKTDGKRFIAYADLKMMERLGKDGEVRPPKGLWKKWSNNKWEEQPDVTVTCREGLDRSFPKLIEVTT